MTQKRRKLPKYGEGSKQASVTRQKHGFGSTGHKAVNVRRVSAAQKTMLSERGYFNIQMNGKQRRVTRCNVTIKSGVWYYAFYKRSDTKKNALRNFCSDQSRTARYRAPKGKRVAGDTPAHQANKPLPKKRKSKKKSKKR